MIVNLPTKLISVIRVTNFLRVLPTRWRRKPVCIDMERNYVTVTQCIIVARKDYTSGCFSDCDRYHRHRYEVMKSNRAVYLDFLGSPLVDGQVGFRFPRILNLVRRIARRPLRSKHSAVVCTATAQRRCRVRNGASTCNESKNDNFKPTFVYLRRYEVDNIQGKFHSAAQTGGYTALTSALKGLEPSLQLQG